MEIIPIVIFSVLGALFLLVVLKNQVKDKRQEPNLTKKKVAPVNKSIDRNTKSDEPAHLNKENCSINEDKDMESKIIAIDFETAKGTFPCQIGIAAVDVHNSKIGQTFCKYIQPPGNEYSQYNVFVHHITPEQTEHEPEFPVVWREIKTFFENAIIVAHNAPFDLNVLHKTLDYYSIDYPHIVKVVDTCRLFEGKKLDVACYQYGICLERHHNALDDAIACANLLLAKIRGVKQITDEEPEPESSNTNPFGKHEALRGDVLKKDLSDADPNNPFYNKKVVITGVFTHDRKELANRLKKMGADIDTSVSSRTNIMLVGIDAGPAKLKKLQDLKKEGYDIRVLHQEDLDEIISKFQ